MKIDKKYLYIGIGIIIFSVILTTVILLLKKCSPNCNGKNCGSDGCGGSCGSCTGNQTCNPDNSRCECAPNCGDHTCENDGCDDCDGCGGSCRSCPNGQTCNNGKCGCIPDCNGGRCGDGCGNACTNNPCPVGQTCSADGSKCIGCISNCNGGRCGDGCGNACTNNPCPVGQTCSTDGSICITHLPLILIGGVSKTTESGIIYSGNYGSSWSSVNYPLLSCMSLAYDKNLWLAGSGYTQVSSKAIMYSNDGISWNSTTVTGGNLVSCYSIYWSENLQLWGMVGRGDKQLGFSSDGMNWNLVVDIDKLIVAPSAICCIGSTWVVGGHSNNTGSLFYKQGDVWYPSTSPNKSINCLTSDGKTMLCGTFSDGNYSLFYSTDGKQWEGIQLPTINDSIILLIISIDYSKTTGRWIISCNVLNTCYLLYSDDLKTWIIVNSLKTVFPIEIIVKSVHNGWLACESDQSGNNTVQLNSYYSTDLMSWIKTQTPLYGSSCIASN